MIFTSDDCSAVSRNQSGIYAVNLALNGDLPIYTDVYCDMERNGGGWTVSGEDDLSYNSSFLKYSGVTAKRIMIIIVYGICIALHKLYNT